MKKSIKRAISVFLAAVIFATVLPLCIPAVSAASWPGLSASAYCEFTASKTINAYRNSSCTTRGTYSPAKSYNAYIAKNDVCYIQNITSSCITLKYPTSSGLKTAFIKRSDLFSVSAPTEVLTSKAKVTTYKYDGGASYGYIDKGDKVYIVGTSGSYYAVIYQAKSGNRAYKLGYITQSGYNSVKGSAVPAGYLSPLKGTLTRSSACKTNGQYCDYKASAGTPIYAPADGTVQFRQTYAVKYNKLSSYGNNIFFTSSDGTVTVLMAHLKSFNNVSLRYTSSLSYPCSASSYSSKTVTLATRSVKKGELLGYTGSTGNASGPHLHMEVKQNKKAVNPTSFFKTW